MNPATTLLALWTSELTDEASDGATTTPPLELAAGGAVILGEAPDEGTVDIGPGMLCDEEGEDDEDDTDVDAPDAEEDPARLDEEDICAVLELRTLLEDPRPPLGVVDWLAESAEPLGSFDEIEELAFCAATLFTKASRFG
jgi:hypothetical protein